MSEFEPEHVIFEGRFTARGEVDEVFGLFSPAGERLWVPGWEPEFLHPGDPAWEEGQVFRTKEEQGDAIWVVSRLDRPIPPECLTPGRAGNTWRPSPVHTRIPHLS